MFRTVFFTAAVCVLLVGATVASAANTNSADMKKVDEADRLFLQSLAPSNEADIQLSNLAMHTTTNPQVKEFATKVAASDSRLQSELKDIAQKTGVPLPSTLDKADVTLKNGIESETSDQRGFDALYMQAMLDKFHAARNAFRVEEKATSNPMLRQLAQNTTPKLEKTLGDAISIDSNLASVKTAQK